MIEPDIFPDLDVETKADFLREFQRADRMIKAGVELQGEPSAYGLVWEWGNRRQKKAGPRTVLGMNPKGKSIWMSSQAPFGWIRINESFLLRIVDEVMAQARFDEPGQVREELKRLAKKISNGWAEVLREEAPQDTGALRKAIKPIDPDDAILRQEADELDALELE